MIRATKAMLRTPQGAGLAILIVLILVSLTGCQPEPQSVAWTAADCHEGRCYR